MLAQCTSGLAKVVLKPTALLGTCLQRGFKIISLRMVIQIARNCPGHDSGQLFGRMFGCVGASRRPTCHTKVTVSLKPSATDSIPNEFAITANEPFGTHKMRLQYFERVRSRLGLGVVSDHDIETFFLCDWASRIWTFQEIVLANNPVAVCGDSHIFWSQLAMGVTFLSSIYGRNHARRMWMEIILSRVYFHDKNKSEHGLEGNSSKYERIIRYWKFVRSIKRFCRRWYFWCKFLGVLAGFVTTLVMLRLIGRKGVTSESDLAFLPFPICLILSIGISLYHYLSFNPGFPRLSDPLLEESLKMRKDVYGTLLDTLRIRKATNPRDMSFGLRSVLRRSTQSSLPPVDYTASISSTYMHLTYHLLTETNSLHFLALAAQANFPDAPSWVPDFSKSLLPVEPQKDFDPGSQSSWHLDPATGSDILTVKGAFIDNVVSKRRLIQTNTTYQESDWTAHLTNLKTMLLSVKIWEYSNTVHYLNEVFKPEFTDELYGSRDAQSRTRLLFTYHDYVHLLKDYRYSDPKDLLQDLIRDCQSENLWNTGRRSHSTADIFNLHIYLCNKMCEKYTLIETETGAGFRPNHIEIGDRIILVPGLPEPLIVRPSGSSVRIVALAGAYSIWDMTEMDRSRKAEGIELEEINIS